MRWSHNQLQGSYKFIWVVYVGSLCWMESEISKFLFFNTECVNEPILKLDAPAHAWETVQEVILEQAQLKLFVPMWM